VISEPGQIDRVRHCFGFLQQDERGFAAEFFAHTKLIQLARSQVICHQGMQCSQLALVLSGVARVFKLGESGREITLYRIGRGQSCILTASCIISTNPFPAIAECEEDLEAVLIQTRDVQRWLNEYPQWRRYLFGLISERLSDVIAIVEEVAFKRVDRRIAAHLLARAEKLQTGTLRTTHQEIASELGTSREVVSRILKDLENQGCISVGRGQIILLEPQNLRLKAADS
jgi:CRP/FNR family transcriptional regulator